MGFIFDKLRRLAALGLILPALTSCASTSIPAPGLLAHWEGDSRIIMTWRHQTDLHVKLDLQADGSVTGGVGHARLTAISPKPAGPQ
jgi:hypothetical protein